MWKLGVRKNLFFTGHITDDEVFLSAYAACDVFVLPSEYEAFGIVLLEAMACRKPVVASRVGGVPEAVGSGGAGMLVEYGDHKGLARKLTGLLNDPEWRRKMGRQCRRCGGCFRRQHHIVRLSCGICRSFRSSVQPPV